MDELKKYIIEFSEDPHTIRLLKLKNGDKYPVTEFKTVTPYTEPDLEQVRKEAFEKGYNTAVAEQECAVRGAAEKGYQKGLSDAWEAARKINLSAQEGGYNLDTMHEIFGTANFDTIMQKAAFEAIEKIRQYEQEKDRQARIEYNFDEVKDVIKTTAKEYNMSLDEIVEVIKKMGEH